MAQFQLGGSVSLDNTFQSSFARELVKESSISCNDSVYKSSFAMELLESAHNSSNTEKNIYEKVNNRSSLEANPFLDDTTDFRRCSQIFSSTMVGSSPRESLSSISRVQTVLSLTSQSQDDSERPELDNYSKLQMELQLLQTKLSNMEKSRITYETTNQQLLSLINKLSSQLSRNVKSSHLTTGGVGPTQQKTVSSSSGVSSSFRRQKAIRIKKRDSVRSRVSVRGDAASYTSSDSGNYSDNDETNNLHRLLRKGLHLVNNVNQELESAKARDIIPENGEPLKACLSSSISQAENSKKVVIKIEARGGGEDERNVERNLTEPVVPSLPPTDIYTNSRGSVQVPVPFYV